MLLNMSDCFQIFWSKIVWFKGFNLIDWKFFQFFSDSPDISRLSWPKQVSTVLDPNFIYAWNFYCAWPILDCAQPMFRFSYFSTLLNHIWNIKSYLGCLPFKCSFVEMLYLRESYEQFDIRFFFHIASLN